MMFNNAIGGVPVKVAAKVYGKDPSWVRMNMLRGTLPIGVVTTAEDCKRHNYYISPKLLYEHTGFVYERSKEGDYA